MAIDAMQLRKDDTMRTLHSTTNKDDGVTAHVFQVDNTTSYLVRLHDDDAGEFLPPFVWFNTLDKAKAYADKCALGA